MMQQAWEARPDARLWEGGAKPPLRCSVDAMGRHGTTHVDVVFTGGGGGLAQGLGGGGGGGAKRVSLSPRPRSQSDIQNQFCRLRGFLEQRGTEIDHPECCMRDNMRESRRSTRSTVCSLLLVQPLQATPHCQSHDWDVLEGTPCNGAWHTGFQGTASKRGGGSGRVPVRAQVPHNKLVPADRRALTLPHPVLVHQDSNSAFLAAEAAR